MFFKSLEWSSCFGSNKTPRGPRAQRPPGANLKTRTNPNKGPLISTETALLLFSSWISKIARSIVRIIKSPALMNNTRSSSADPKTTLTRALLSFLISKEITRSLICSSHSLNYLSFTQCRLWLWSRAASCIKAQMFETDGAMWSLPELMTHLVWAESVERTLTSPLFILFLWFVCHICFQWRLFSFLVVKSLSRWD